MEKFASHKVLKMTQNEIENLTTPTTRKNIGLIIIIINCPKKAQAQRKPSNVYQIFKR